MLDKEKFQDKGKEPKFSIVATEAAKPAANQPREIPQVPAKLLNGCTIFSLKDLSKSFRPMHEYSIDFVKRISCLVTNIGHVELKIHADEQGELKVTINGNMIKINVFTRCHLFKDLEVQKPVSTTILNKFELKLRKIL